MYLRLFASAIGIIAALAACGGGGGNGSAPATNPTPATTPTLIPSQGQTTTNASGTVVDDGTGTALAGVAVKLMPWAPCGPTPSPATSITPENDGCPTPLPSPQATTAANGSFALDAVPNGHYLLIIGTDTVSTPPAGYAPPTCTTNCGTPTPAPFAVQATVHDNVTLTGGNQTLVAPRLPTVPSGYTPPSWETNGDYRLATLNTQTEMPCYIAWQYERVQNNLAGASVDEWLTENERANLGYAVANNQINPVVLSSKPAEVSGGTACATALVLQAFAAGANSYAADPRTLWFGGAYDYYGFSTNPNVSAFGLAEFPIDPRSYADPNHPTWP
jgi:hypothetical protein